MGPVLPGVKVSENHCDKQCTGYVHLSGKVKKSDRGSTFFRSRNRSQRRPGSGRRPKSVGQNKLDEANRKLNEDNLGKFKKIF